MARRLELRPLAAASGRSYIAARLMALDAARDGPSPLALKSFWSHWK
jgi:hypothetical protein